MARLHDRYVFNFLKDCQLVFLSFFFFPTCFPILLYLFTFPSAVCQLDQIKNERYSLVCLWVFLGELHIPFSRPHKKTNSPSAMWVGIIQSIESWDKAKRWRKGKFFFLDLGYPSSPALGMGVADYQAFGPGLNIPAVFLVLQACRWQIARLLSLHNHKSKFLEQISSYICVF